jgi:hypothetical protein
MNLRQPHWIITHTLLALLLLTFSSIAFAYSDYSGCESCHGDFNESSNYTSKTDGAAWSKNLMYGHVDFGITCNACHKGGSYGEVYLNLSADASLSKSCVGCHGRDEDVNDSCVGSGDTAVQCGSGAGLRSKHALAGVTTCGSCHAGDSTPVGEQVNPFNYGMAGVLMTNACNADGSESQFGSYGLDNDGDGQADADDSDCAPFEINPGLSGNWWGGSTRSGEGFLIDVAYNVVNDVIIVVSFYTYDTEGNQVWLIGPGVANGDTATVEFEIPVGAKWGAEFNKDDVNRVPWGTGTFTFTSCDAGYVSFAPNAEMQALGFTNLEYGLNRDILIYGIQCPIQNP